MTPTLLRASKVFLPEPSDADAVLVEDGRIAAVGRGADLERATTNVLDLGPLAIVPGLIDTHVHISGSGTRTAVTDRRDESDQIQLLRCAGNGALNLREGRFPAGTFVVRLDQPYRNYAVDLLTPQSFPKDGGEPYDDISWELPAHYRLAAVPITDPAVRSAALTVLTDAPQPEGHVEGTGPVFLLKDTGQ